MRIESIEDVTTLEPAQAQLLEEGIEEGWFDEADQRALVVYRVKDTGSKSRPLVAPRNPKVNRGSVIVCTGWARTAFQVTLGTSEEGDVTLDVAAHVEVDDLD